MTQMFTAKLVLAASLPSRARVELKAILLPSGDHTGSPLETLAVVIFVNGSRAEPAWFMRQIFVMPMEASLPVTARVDWKAIAGPANDVDPPPPQPLSRERTTITTIAATVRQAEVAPCNSRFLRDRSDGSVILLETGQNKFNFTFLICDAVGEWAM
jgi:hypothetical protein